MHMDAPTRTQTVNSGSASRRAADAALVDRIRLLRTILPAMVDDLAHARREIHQLRRENTRLKQRLTRYQAVSTKEGQPPGPHG
jgi:phage shock protein A